MRPPIAAIGLCIALLSTSCGSRKPPEALVAAFARLHPQAHITEWKDEPPNWEAKYTSGDTTGAVSFNANAEVVETELVVPVERLPFRTAVEAYIDEHYPAEVVQRCEMITGRDGTVTYEVQITGKELVFDAGGMFIAEEQD